MLGMQGQVKQIGRRGVERGLIRVTLDPAYIDTRRDQPGIIHGDLQSQLPRGFKKLQPDVAPRAGDRD